MIDSHAMGLAENKLGSTVELNELSRTGTQTSKQYLFQFIFVSGLFLCKSTVRLITNLGEMKYQINLIRDGTRMSKQYSFRFNSINRLCPTLVGISGAGCTAIHKTHSIVLLV